jgi:SNF2 family DNA or RNA helicase
VTPQDYHPRDYQVAITRQILSQPRTNVWAGMGAGKTVSTLTAIDILLTVLGEEGPVLVVAPLRVATSVWPVEVRKWKHLHRLRVIAIVGDAETRKSALRAVLAGRADVATINYDNLVWLVEIIGDKWPFKIVIADESTKLKSFRLKQGAKRAQALGRVAHPKVRRFVNLTGTPAPNGLKDLWGQNWFIDAGERLGRTYQAFEDRWFEAVRNPNTEFHDKRPRDFAQEQIEDKLRDRTLTVNPADHLDLPKLIRNVIEVDLPARARASYRDMEREMFTELENGQQLEAFNAASKTIKCLQLANGAAYTDDQGTWTEIHKMKLEALEDIVEEAAGMPVLVAYHFKSDLARLKVAFPRGRELDKKPQTIVDWNEGRIPLLFAHPASAGHGLNLQDGSNIMAFFGLWWDLEQHDQIIERIGPTRQAQSGHNRPVYIHYIAAKRTVDMTVLQRLETKRGVQDLLLEAMKRRD